jgi:hypothetical protein
MLSLKYAAQTSLPGPMPKPEEVCIFRLTPVVKGGDLSQFAALGDFYYLPAWKR